MSDEEIERVALFIAYRCEDGRTWREDCPEWVRDRYRSAARLAWLHVIGRTPDQSRTH